MVRKRHPTIANAMTAGIDRDPAPRFQSVRNCEHVGRCRSGNPIVERDGNTSHSCVDPEPTGHKNVRQQKVSRQLQEKFCRGVVWPSLSDPERALLRSQHGHLASAAMTALPTSSATKIAALPFRLLLCRRLRLPPPLSARACRCARQLDVFGHHRAACVQNGVPGWTGFPSSALQHRCVGRLGRGWRPTRTLNFGQSEFGQFDFSQWAEIELAKVKIGRNRIGQSALCLCSLVCLWVSVSWALVSVGVGGAGFTCGGAGFTCGRCGVPPDPSSAGPILRWTALRRTAQNLALFSLSRRKFLPGRVHRVGQP